MNTKKFDRLPPRLDISPRGAEQRLDSTRHSTAVLLIHGYTGLTSDWLFVAEQLHDRGFTVHIPRLPGHGTNAADFLTTTRNDWLRRCIDEYAVLASTHNQVYVAGLSMGALLAIQIAVRFPVPRLVLAAPALTVTNKALRFTPLIRPFIKTLARPAGEDDDRDPELKTIADEYWSVHHVPMLAELRHLQVETGRLLPRVVCDTMIIVSKNDRTVPLSVANYIQNTIKASNQRVEILSESGHIVVNDVEREHVAARISDFFGS